MKRRVRSKDAKASKGVPILHVPVHHGTCWLVPTSDFRNRDRFACWTRALDSSGIIANSAWRAQAERLFSEEIAAARRGEETSVARLVAAFPQALFLNAVRDALHRAAADGDPRPFSAIAKALAPHRRPQVGAETEKTVARIHWAASEASGLSRRAVFTKVTGGQEEDGKDFEAVSASYKRFVRAWGGYPRVHAIGVACHEHHGSDGIFEMKATLSDLPATYLSDRDHPPLGRKEQPPGKPVFPPRFSSKWEVKFEPTGHEGERVALVTPDRPLGLRRKGRSLRD